MKNKKQEILEKATFELDIIELMEEKDNYTTSDLQGRVEAIVTKIYEAGKRK